MDKAEIEKIIRIETEASDSESKSATSSLTSLIIKWLEGKEYDYYSESGAPVEMDNFEASAYAKGVVKGRNQLITELVEELR